MGRQKGDGKGRLGGRAKGTPNKINAELGERVGTFIEENFEEFSKMLARIVDPEKYCYYYLKMLEFRLPKKAAVSVSAEGKVSDLKSELEQLAETEE